MSGARCGMVLQRRAGNRHERHHERVDSHADQALGHGEDRFRRVSEPGEDIGRDLALAEDRNGGGESVEIAVQRHARLAGHDSRPDLRGHRLEMQAERIDARRLQPGEPAVVIGRLALGLDRQVHRRLHREGALAEHGRPSVGGVGRARGHHHVLDAVEEHGGAGDLRELLRRLVGDGSPGRERLSDGAELAGLGAALVADAGLQHRGGEHVAPVQHGDLRIGHPVEGLEPVEPGLARKRHTTDHGAVMLDEARPVGIRPAHEVGRVEGARGMDRHHHGAAGDGHRLVVGRARPRPGGWRPRRGCQPT